MGFMTEIAQPLIDGGLVEPTSIEGCSRSEIDDLMTAQNVTLLPRDYAEFMSFGGRNPYWLSRDGEWDYDWLRDAKTIAREIVEDDYSEDFSPYADAFIFQTHQGYMFYYFRREDLASDDPHFWIYTGNRPLQSSEDTFTEWIRMLAADLPRVIETRKRLYG
ncbi:SMI1/KNR4 family protein [Nocardia higoensis]|uniref:SMI1/KNR4 family protein n=1 Tax=Nocardia higoensis TaxID=228599 RepID=UPI0002DB1BBE|nr:hypothetical protein [Nocardia higoensis]